MESPNPEGSSYRNLVLKITAQIEDFKIDLESQIPMLRTYSEKLIAERSRNRIEIELILDSLLSLTFLGHAETEFLNLLTYYKKVSPSDAEFYHREYFGSSSSGKENS